MKAQITRSLCAQFFQTVQEERKRFFPPALALRTSNRAYTVYWDEDYECKYRATYPYVGMQLTFRKRFEFIVKYGTVVHSSDKPTESQSWSHSN